MPLLDKTRKLVFSRTGKWLIGSFAVGVATFWWCGNGLITSQFEKALIKGANKGGMALEWKTSSWDPWRGLHLTGLRLSSSGDKNATLAELENLNVNLPLHQIFESTGRQIRWSVNDSDVNLYDPAGMVKLEKVSLDIKVRNGEIQVLDFRSGDKGLTTQLRGKLIFNLSAGRSSGPPAIDLAPLRATLAALDVSREKGPFHATGNFTIDLRNNERHWITNLKGAGRDLEWKGVRWKFAAAEATLSSTSSEIRYDLHTANGSTRGTISKNGWRDSPFLFKGELNDPQNRKDDYHGNYHKRVLTVESLKGSANLQLLSRDIPVLAYPEEIEFKTFPMIDLRNLIWYSSSEEPHWSFASLTATAKDEISITTNGREIELRNLSFDAAYDGEELIVRESAAGVFNGNVTMKGSYREGILRESSIGLENIKLAEIKHMIGSKRRKAGPGVLSMDFQGKLDFRKKRADGAGSMRLENAPVLEVPLLDQVYDIFIELIPGVERANEGTFDANFQVEGGIVNVTKFEAKGGSLTVSARGEIDLDAHRVSGRARGKLVGLPGLVTKPLSRLLEMDVAGPYEDIRVKPLGPAKLASNTASGTVGAVVDTIEETGKIAGTVLSEGVKLPFRLFGQDKEEEKKTD